MPFPNDYSLDDQRGKARFLASAQRHGLGAAGTSFLDANYDPRWQQLSLRNAQNFQQAAGNATMALGADSGSIAARNNPFNPESLARRQFGDTFGVDNMLAYDDLNRRTDDDNRGMTRRSFYNAISNIGGTYGSGF